MATLTEAVAALGSPPSPPNTAVPISDPAWRDFFTRQQQWLARLAAAIAQSSTSTSGS